MLKETYLETEEPWKHGLDESSRGAKREDVTSALVERLRAEMTNSEMELIVRGAARMFEWGRGTITIWEALDTSMVWFYG